MYAYLPSDTEVTSTSVLAKNKTVSAMRKKLNNNVKKVQHHKNKVLYVLHIQYGVNSGVF